MNVYDFDKTVYAGDSTLDFYLYCFRKYPRIVFYLPTQIGSALLYVMGVYSKVRFKEVFYSFICSLKDIDGIIAGFWMSHEHKIQEWYKEKKQESDVVISASPEFLLQPMCERLGIKVLIASKVDKATGRYDGENCEGQNKVVRLYGEFTECVIDEFYSDSLSDTPLADLARQSFRVDGKTIVAWSDYKPKGFQKAKMVFASKEFIVFLIIGVINAINGVLFAYLFSLLMDVNTAFIAGYVISLSLSYLLNSFFTFKESLSGKKYIKFCFSYVPNFLIQNMVVLIVYNLLDWYKVFAYAFAAIIGVPITFILVKYFAFKKKTVIKGNE